MPKVALYPLISTIVTSSTALTLDTS